MPTRAGSGKTDTLKDQSFMWFLHIKVIITKNNLAKRNWRGETSNARDY